MCKLSDEEFREFTEWQAQNRLLDAAYEGLNPLDADLKDFARFRAYKDKMEQQKQNPYTPTDLRAVANRVMELAQNRR